MFKRPRLIKAFKSEHAKASEALMKSAWQHFYNVFSWLWWRLRCKMSLLVICEILGLFLNTLFADDKYSLRNGEKLHNQFKWNYLRNKRLFWNFDGFLKFTSNFETFEEKMTLIGDVFFIIKPAKNVLR